MVKKFILGILFIQKNTWNKLFFSTYQFSIDWLVLNYIYNQYTNKELHQQKQKYYIRPLSQSYVDRLTLFCLYIDVICSHNERINNENTSQFCFRQLIEMYIYNIDLFTGVLLLL